MYDPVFNSVLVEIDDADAVWGSGNDDSMLGKSYSKGKIIQVGNLVETADHPLPKPGTEIRKLEYDLSILRGRNIMWNEGTEAGTLFDFDGKQYGMIYWWDIRGVLKENNA